MPRDKEKIINIRVNEEEKRRIKQLAEINGFTSLSEYIRTTLFKETQKIINTHEHK